MAEHYGAAIVPARPQSSPFPTERRDFSKSVFDAVAYSAVNFVALSPLLYWMGAATRPQFLRDLAALIVFVLAPIGWPILLFSVQKTRWFVKRFSHPILRPWDYYFSKCEPCWVVVHLKDRKIGGYYSGPQNLDHPLS